jgi:DNA-binding transcriptional ArsR family regulator
MCIEDWDGNPPGCARMMRTEGGRESARWNMLSLDLKICMKIYELERRKEKVWLGKLVRILSNDASKVTISKTVDRLFDLGIVDGKWEEVEGKWTRVLTVAGEAEGFVRSVSTSVSGRPKN